MARPIDARLPVNGAWTIDGLNRGAAINHDIPLGQFEYITDLIRRDAPGGDHQGDPAENGSYFCFGKDVTSPLDGEVIQLERNIPDNTPAHPNYESLLGNYVLIKHEDIALFSLLAHLRHGSTIVKAGMRVEEGVKVAECGNSGLSYAPHVSFALLRPGNSPYKSGTIFDVLAAQSVAVAFRNVNKRGWFGTARNYSMYTPRLGDTIESAL